MNGAAAGDGPVHVSLSELRTAASRALEGAGAPAGTERDGARCVVWLESRGLGGAAGFVHDIPFVAEAGSRPPVVDDGRLIDLASHSVFVWGSTLVELAMLEPGTTFVLRDCRTPCAILAEAAIRTRKGWYFRLRAGESEALAGGDEIALDRSFAGLRRADVHLVASAGGPPPKHPAAAPRSRLSSAELEARRLASLSTGLRLDARDWRAIRAAATRVLVPASERSRSHGAGAEVDDNE